MSTNLKIVIGIVVGAIVGIGGYWILTQYGPLKSSSVMTNSATSTDATTTQTAAPAAQTPVADVTYACDAQKKIHAVYFSDKVIVELSDGRAMQIPQAISADGARYANKDGTLVFWSKGPTAFLTEAGKNTYDKCIDLTEVNQDSTSLEGPGAN